MRKGLRILAFFVIALSVILFPFACTTGKLTQSKAPQQNKEARALIAAANKHYETSNRMQDEINSMFLEASDFQETPESWQHSISIFQETEGKINQQNTELLSAIGEHKKVAILNISGDLKKYAQLMIHYSEKMIESNKLFLKMNQMMIQRLQSDIAGTSTEESVMKLRIEGQGVGDEFEKLGTEADDIKKKADALYKKKNLGKL